MLVGFEAFVLDKEVHGDGRSQCPWVPAMYLYPCGRSYFVWYINVARRVKTGTVRCWETIYLELVAVSTMPEFVGASGGKILYAQLLELQSENLPMGTINHLKRQRITDDMIVLWQDGSVEFRYDTSVASCQEQTCIP